MDRSRDDSGTEGDLQLDAGDDVGHRGLQQPRDECRRKDSLSRPTKSSQAVRAPATTTDDGRASFARLTGLDIKIEQYRQGEAFINYVVKERSHDFARQVWIGPEYLPTLEEIKAPESWIARVEAM